jgi:2-oxoglutarate ferredoxin oxidoreductase subunit beta
VLTAGHPVRMSEILATLPGAAYITRQQALDPTGIRRTKKAIELAFRTQLAGLGFSMVEILAHCNTNWHMTPMQAIEWAKEHMVDYYPPGDKKITDDVRALRRKR